MESVLTMLIRSSPSDIFNISNQMYLDFYIPLNDAMCLLQRDVTVKITF